ncbi:MAG: alanine racemase [Negativicutes bacterium]
MESVLKQVRPTYIVIEMDNIVHNLKELMRCTAKGTKTMAVVKADAYGHGIVEVSQTCHDNGADYLGVAILEEGIFLRENGIKAPIIILGATFPERAADVIKHDLIQGVSSTAIIKSLAQAAREMKKNARVHIKIETGMNRIGAIPGADMNNLIEELKNNQDCIKVEGAFSHFAKADEKDKSYAAIQYDNYSKGLEQLAGAGFRDILRHMANSAGIIDLPETHLDMVRQGISLYGYYPSREVRQDVDLKPALSWITHVAHVKVIPAGGFVGYGCTYVAGKESIIATLPVGYADGYPRALSNCGSVLIHGSRAPIVGRVCMDQMMVDVSFIEGVKMGDQAILIGRQGEAAITAEDLANQTGTISHEILTGIATRVPRIFKYQNSCSVEDRMKHQKYLL